MRIFVLLLLVFCAPLTWGKNYSFETLVAEHKNHIAPAGIQTLLRSIEKEPFADCVKDGNLSKADQASYFSSFSLQIGGTGSRYYLVLPSTYCSAFVGAHAISYWIVHEDPSSRFTLIYRGASDGIDILSSKTNGLFDIRSSYGSTYIILKFDGSKYTKAAEGDYENLPTKAEPVATTQRL